MAVSASVNVAATFGSSAFGGTTVTKSSDILKEVSIAIPAPSTDKEVTITAIAANVKGVAVEADQDMILQANDGTAPDFTWTLLANKPAVWTSDMPFANPITDDLTKFLVTLGGVTAATLKIAILEDITP
jgi:hypothetical protein